MPTVQIKLGFLFIDPVHKFTEALKDSQADEKSSVTLKCETAQTPSNVMWLKGHTELKSGGRYEMSQKERVLTLTIKHVGEEDTDIYTCDVGTAKTMAKVTVKGKAIFIQVRGKFLCYTADYLLEGLIESTCLQCLFFERG